MHVRFTLRTHGTTPGGGGWLNEADTGEAETLAGVWAFGSDAFVRLTLQNPLNIRSRGDSSCSQGRRRSEHHPERQFPSTLASFGANELMLQVP